MGDKSPRGSSSTFVGATGEWREEPVKPAKPVTAALDEEETREGGVAWVRLDMAEAISFSFFSENCERIVWMLLETGKPGINVGAADTGIPGADESTG